MNRYYPHPMASRKAHRSDLSLLLDAAKTGAVVGASGAAAVSLHRIRREEIEWQEALNNTLKVGAAAGVATGAATAVGKMFERSPLLSLAATLVTGTAVMYALNNRQQEKGYE